MRHVPQDLWFALRNLWKSPGFSLVAIITLAVAIGGNTAIFSIVDAILLRPLPYRDATRLVRLYQTESAPGKYPFTGPDFVDWRAQNRTLEDMAVYTFPRDRNLSGGAAPEHLQVIATQANFFDVLGVQPLIGRTWASGEDQPEKNHVALLGYGLWNSLFAGDPGVIGKTIELDSERHTIVGVLPPDFRYSSRAALWVPFDMSSKGLGTRGNHWLSAVGRLKPGVSVAAARADLKLIASRLEQQYPESNHKVGAEVVPLRDDLVGQSRNSLYIMLAAVGLVLLIACANVANLLLSRAVGRHKEMAVRSALGAGRGRLVAQLLTESLVLAVAGAAVGLLIGWGIVEAFSRTQAAALPRFNAIRLNGTVLAFTALMALATGILFGLYPAFRTVRADVHDELRGGAGSAITPGRGRRTTSSALVVCEVAFSLVLLASAGLLLKDFVRLRSLDVGVRTEGVWTATISLPEAGYPKSPQQSALANALVERAAHIPGVDSAALTSTLPIEGGSNYYIQIRGRIRERMSGPLVESHSASPGYFRTMGVRLIKGRLFTSAEAQAAADLEQRLRPIWEREHAIPADIGNASIYPVVINETMWRTFWPDQDPIGQMFTHSGANGPWQQVVGVVSDVRQWGLTNAPVPEAYDPFTGGGRFYLVLHTARDPAALAPAVRESLKQLDSALPLFAVRTMDDVIAESARGQRFLSVLIGSFALLAALLAAVGMYGVLSCLVTQHTHEIGIRMALGASRARVLGGVLGRGAVLAGGGLLAGLAGAWAAGKVLASLLHEVRPLDPAILAMTAGVLASVAFVACYIPARRAARMDPMNALRHE